jgi:DNA-binding CsgD family transcriptional regulator
MTTAFVGRVDELATVVGLADAARRGSGPAAALILGDPGAGKTRLLTEIIDRAGFDTRLRLTGLEPLADAPLAAAAPLLRWLARAGEAGRRLDALALSGTEASSDVLRVFEAARRARLAAGAVFLTVDDLQWVDHLTIGLLEYLLSGAAAPPIVLVAASRRSPRAATLVDGLRSLGPQVHSAIVELSGLSLDEAMRLVADVAPATDRAVATDMWHRAAGSPFWITALLRSGVSDRPTDVMAERLGALTSDAAELLGALAVVARPAAVTELVDVLRWPEDRVRAASAELAARGLVVDSMAQVRTAHDLIREAALPGLPGTVRRRLHAGFAAHGERTAGDQLPSLREALEHRLAAGLPAGDLALRVASADHARLLGSDVLAVLVSVADGLDPVDARELDARIASLATGLGEQSLAVERWLRVADSESGAAREKALLGAGRSAYRARDHRVARSILARLEAPTSLAVEAQVETLASEVALWLEMDTEQGASAAARALAAADRLASAAGGAERLAGPDRATYIAAVLATMDTALQRDRGDELVGLAETALDVASLSDPEARISVLIRVAFALRPTGRVREAAEHYRAAWDLASELALPAERVDAGIGLARCLRNLGRLVEANQIASETVRSEARLRFAPRRWGSAAMVLHSIELSTADPAEAIRGLWADAAAESSAHARIPMHQLIAESLSRSARSEDRQEAEAALTAAQRDADISRCPRCGAELSVVTATVLARLGRPEAARMKLESWERSRRGTHVQAELHGARATATVLEAEGHLPEASAVLTALAVQQAEAGLELERLWTLLDHGRVLLRLDDQSGAIAALEAAATAAEDVGAKVERRLAAGGLRKLGVRAWRRGGLATGSDRLSEREAEVAQLVAVGASNREIAESLLIAPKTVERHVSNAMIKLGARNRTELASTVGRSGRVRVSPDDREEPRP